MASGSALAAPVQGSGWPFYRKLTRGQLFSATISVQMVMHQLASFLAASADVPFSTWPPFTAGRSRPFIFLRETEVGLHVYPLSTFGGAPPDNWNLLQRAFVLPIGDNFPDIFHDRPSFQTQPAWKHQEGNPSYIVPGTVILPFDVPLRDLRVPTFMDLDMVDQLENYSWAVVQNLQNGSREELIELLTSYESQPSRKTFPTCPSVKESVEVANGPTKSTLNPNAPKFIPGAARSDVLSFPDFADSACATTSSSSVSSVEAPSILQALQNTPLSTRPREIDVVLRKPALGAYKEDKENMRL